MKQYIVWVGGRGKGFCYYEYDTLREAILHDACEQSKIITKRVEFEIKEKE
jgi:hypothetical protein